VDLDTLALTTGLAGTTAASRPGSGQAGVAPLLAQLTVARILGRWLTMLFCSFTNAGTRAAAGPADPFLQDLDGRLVGHREDGAQALRSWRSGDPTEPARLAESTLWPRLTAPGARPGLQEPGRRG